MSVNVISMNGLLECEYFDLQSQVVNDEFRIFVARPPFAGGQKLPAIYVADGNTLFTQVMGIQRTLAWGAEASPAYVIGIGYPTERGFMQAVSKRNRDYAPTDDGEYAKQVLFSPWHAGGAAFRSFIVEELNPVLAQRYPIDFGDTTFVGASLAALFGAWVLLTTPATFGKYVLSSPALWWNHHEVWNWEGQYAGQQGDLAASVFVSAGELEHPQAHRAQAARLIEKNPMLRPQVEAVSRWHDAHGWPCTAELAAEFAQRLAARQYPSLRVCCHNMPDETHMSVTSAAISRGLRYLGGEWPA